MEEKVKSIHVKPEEDLLGLTVRGYTKGNVIGRGTYGVVFEGNRGGRKVAMKKVRTKGKGIDFSFIREVKLSQELCNDHILGVPILKPIPTHPSTPHLLAPLLSHPPPVPTP